MHIQNWSIIQINDTEFAIAGTEFGVVTWNYQPSNSIFVHTGCIQAEGSGSTASLYVNRTPHSGKEMLSLGHINRVYEVELAKEGYTQSKCMEALETPSSGRTPIFTQSNMYVGLLRLLFAELPKEEL